MSLDRRSFIRYASLAATGALAGLRPFGAINALAQTTTAPADYKALVCIFLFGGNDSNNLIVPFDASGYANYASLRGPLALGQSQLLQLASTPNFGLNAALPEVKHLFDSGAAALVANVGTLLRTSRWSGKTLRKVEL